MPQYFPCPKVPDGKAAKYGAVPVLLTLSEMPDGHGPPLLLPLSVPQ
jgi:hypothetical protein